jgi:hypothetical protein
MRYLLLTMFSPQKKAEVLETSTRVWCGFFLILCIVFCKVAESLWRNFRVADWVCGFYVKLIRGWVVLFWFGDVDACVGDWWCWFYWWLSL